MNTRGRAFVTGGIVALAWAAEARAQSTDPVEVVCEHDCHELVVHGERTDGFRVRILPDSIEVVTPFAGRGVVEQRVRLTSLDGITWRIAAQGASVVPPQPRPTPPTPPAPDARPAASLAGVARASAPEPAHAAPPAAERPTSSLRMWGVGAIVLGAVGLAVGGVALVQRDEYAAVFNATTGYDSFGVTPCAVRDGTVNGGNFCQRFYDSATTWNSVMLAGFVTGSVLIAGGVVLQFVRPAERPRAASPPRWWIGAGPAPLGGSVGGTF